MKARAPCSTLALEKVGIEGEDRRETSLQKSRDGYRARKEGITSTSDPTAVIISIMMSTWLVLFAKGSRARHHTPSHEADRAHAIIL